MQIQVNSDHNIDGDEAVSQHVTHVVERALGRHSENITRVEVHLSDEKNSKSEHHDKRCMMEARLQGRAPVSVSHHAETLHQAIDGAAEKMVRVIDSTLGRLHDQMTRGEGMVLPEVPASE